MFTPFIKQKLLGITQEPCYRQSFTIIFLQGGVPGSANMISSASEPVFFYLYYTQLWRKTYR